MKQRLEQLIDPSTDQPINIRHLNLDEENSLVTLIVAIGQTGGQEEKTLTRQIAKIVKIDHSYKGLKLNFEPLALPKSSSDSSKQIRYIAITSGKGGVGKSTVTANLAVALNRLGKKVGLIDADIYGPSLPQIFDIPTTVLRADSENKIIPPTAYNIPIMSTEFLVTDDKPLMWRGPMLNRMLNHFFQDVAWETDIDYMLIDLPPGTGDVALDIQKLIPEAAVVVVTTPHPTAAHIAVKAGYMAQSLGHDVLGVVENMSYYPNPVNGAKEAIFGSGGGLKVANQLDTELLASIPIAQPKTDLSHSIYATHEEIGVSYLGLANKIIKNSF